MVPEAQECALCVATSLNKLETPEAASVMGRPNDAAKTRKEILKKAKQGGLYLVPNPLS